MASLSGNRAQYKRMYIRAGFRNDSIRLYTVDISLLHENFNWKPRTTTMNFRRVMSDGTLCQSESVYRFNISKSKILNVDTPRVKNISVIYGTIGARSSAYWDNKQKSTRDGKTQRENTLQIGEPFQTRVTN